MKKKSSVFLLSSLVLLVVLALGVVYVRFRLGPRLAEKGLETVIQSGLGGKATVAKTVIHWLGRPSVEYQGLSIRQTVGEPVWLQIERVVLRPDLKSLFTKSIYLKSLDLDRPVLRLYGDKGPFPPESLLSILPQFDQLKIREGKIEWPDREIQEFFVSLKNLSTSGPFPLVLKGALKMGRGSPAWVSVDGLVHSLPKKWDLSDLRISAKISGEGLDPLWFKDLFVRSVPPELMGTKLAVTAKFEGDLTGLFQSSGTVNMSGSRLFEKTGGLSADFKLTWDGEELDVQKIRLNPPHPPLEVRGRIQTKNRNDPRISFRIDCPWTLIKRGRSVFSLLPRKVRSFLDSVGKGEVALVSMGFTGPLGSLRFPENEELLRHWRGGIKFRDLIVPWNGERVELRKGFVKVDQGTIVAESVDFGLGGSELEIPRLTLSQPFTHRLIDLTLKGDLNLSEIPKWISKGLIPEEVAALVSDVEVLSGKGNVDLKLEKSSVPSISRGLAGSVTLEDVALRIRNLPGTFKKLNGIIELASGDLIVRNLQGGWRGSSVSANGTIDNLFSPRPEIDLSLRGRLDLKNLDEVASWRGFPAGTRPVLETVSALKGEGDYSLTVKGPLTSAENIDVTGELSVLGTSFRLWDAYPMEEVSGRILLSRDRISVPDLKGVWRNSNVALRAVLPRPGSSVARDLTFSANFDLKDISPEGFDHGWPRIWKKILKSFDFQAGKASLEVTDRKVNGHATLEGYIGFEEAVVRYLPVFPPPLGNLKGKVVFSEKGIENLNVLGEFDSSPVSIQADLVPKAEDSDPYLSIQAENIDFEKVLSWPWKGGFSPGRKDRAPLAVHIWIDRGTFREIAVSDVKAELRLNGDSASFEKVTFTSGEGQGLIRGWLGFSENGQVSFELRPYLLNVGTGPIFMSFQDPGSESQITGLGSASGIIRGNGSGLGEIARSLNGEIGLYLEGGEIRQLTVLSKVFSLLDVSQLFRRGFRNQKADGMRYRTISGKVTLKEGKASTSDLFLDGDSMKISLIGDFDIPSGGLDLRLGLRRVGPGGKIVRSVPIFGEIVTSDGGSFIHYYLVVKGTLAEPEVEGIPSMSVTDGFSGIMRRLLETPVKVFPFQRQPDLEQYYKERKHPYP